MLNEPTAAAYALLAMYAEDMFDPNNSSVLDPPLAQLCQGFTLVGYLLANNALFDVQKLNIGQVVYYGFVAQSNADPSDYVAVVRGTGAPIEWVENFEGLLVERHGVGWVEQGFDSIYGSMTYVAHGTAVNKSSAAQAIAQFLPATANVTVIGHSLGAALASYLLLDLATTPHRTFKVFGMLFASPRAGGQDFVQRVHHAVDDYTVYNYIRDIVPHVPPSLPLPISFQSLPNTVWIKPADTQVVIDNNPLCNHHAYCYAAMLDPSSVSSKTVAQSPCVHPLPKAMIGYQRP